MGISKNTKATVKTVSFGDGYTQRFSHGINNKKTNYNGSKTGDYKTVIQPIEEFLEAHDGVIPFYWQDPTGAIKLYTCEQWGVSQNKANIWNISLNFEQFLST